MEKCSISENDVILYSILLGYDSTIIQPLLNRLFHSNYSADAVGKLLEKSSLNDEEIQASFIYLIFYKYKFSVNLEIYLDYIFLRIYSIILFVSLMPIEISMPSNY